jgi:hypothetical protein
MLMKIIRVANVRILVDEDVYYDLRGEKLSATKSGSIYYHGRYKKHNLGKLIMHVAFDDNLIVQHINGDKTDFRRDNLEIITKGELMKKAGIYFPPKVEVDEEEERKKLEGIK